jgi:serine phosphatase RsbU (regulator of sigma subunit)
MRILVGWDDPAEAELLNLYLGGGENEVTVTDSADAFLENVKTQGWDVLLMALAFPRTVEEGFNIFSQVQQLVPGMPIVMGCRPREMISLPRFLTHGLRFYIYRDAQGDFIFLVLSTLESALAAARAEEASKLADHLREEINGVRMLQEAIIPRGLKPPEGYHAVARYEPAHVTTLSGKPVAMAGGDYYDLFCPDTETVVALVGDASGHGLKACMSIMTMHTLIRMLAGAQFRDSSAFVTEINNQLCANSIVQSGGGFITLLYTAVDTARHTVSWSSAGHPPALLHLLGENKVIQVGANDDGGLPLGITAGIEYTAFQFTLPPNSRLLLYSDGLTDAFAPSDREGHNPFGVPGITKALLDCHDRSLDETLDQLFIASHNYTGGEGRHDDTSALLLERNGD